MNMLQDMTKHFARLSMYLRINDVHRPARVKEAIAPQAAALNPSKIFREKVPCRQTTDESPKKIPKKYNLAFCTLISFSITVSSAFRSSSETTLPAPAAETLVSTYA
tara:strand:- start:619 stop:939 length:321 start_codon:yes stop_codon:yes gene_type:complete